jgi:hypothetical protein
MEAHSRVALVGSGIPLLRALDRLEGVTAVIVTAVADASGVSEATRRAERLGAPFLTNPLEVYRTNANVVLEVNGDARQYERLLAVKPPGVEVIGALSAQLLLDLLAEHNGHVRPAAPGDDRVVVVVAPGQHRLYDYLRDGLRGVPGMEVVVDRRHGERRQQTRPVGADRRRGGRRLRPSLDPDFRARGFAIVRRTS